MNGLGTVKGYVGWLVVLALAVFARKSSNVGPRSRCTWQAQTQGVSMEESRTQHSVTSYRLSTRCGCSAAGAPPAPAAGLAGTKRPRVLAPSATEAPAGGAGGGAASAAPAADAPPAAAPTRTQGVGKLITSGTTVHGVATKFKEELKVGDAIEVAHPVSLKAEVRVVKMVLSDVSCGIK